MIKPLHILERFMCTTVYYISECKLIQLKIEIVYFFVQLEYLTRILRML